MSRKTMSPPVWVLSVLGFVASSAWGATHVVNQSGLTFVPDTLTITAGDTVEWHWATGSHTVTEGTPCTPAGGGFSYNLNSGNPIVTHTFSTAGTVDYFCVPHCGLGMTGVITVDPAPPVPAVTEWGLIGLGGLLCAAGVMLFSRRVRPVC